MISIVIPVYNEESSIGQVINDVLSVAHKDWEIIVVDDGSTDNTQEIVKKFARVRQLKHPYKKGYGASLKNGIKNAQGDEIVILDGDGQHDPKEIPELIKGLKEYDLVVGVRAPELGAGLVKTVGNYALRKIAGFLVDIYIPDLTCGFRAFKKKKVMEFVHLYPNGFSMSATSTLSCLSAGYNVKFVPIKLRQRDTNTSSKISVGRDGAKFLLLIFRIIVLFNPMKIFFPISLVLFLLGSGYGLLYIIKIMHIPAGSLMLVLASLIIFFFGLLADQIACIRRQIK
jgi:glycosyltransferase involved in cell wall biosynthesis